MYTLKNIHIVHAGLNFIVPLQSALLKAESIVINKAIQLQPLFIEIFK